MAGARDHYGQATYGTIRMSDRGRREMQDWLAAEMICQAFEAPISAKATDGSLARMILQNFVDVHERGEGADCELYLPYDLGQRYAALTGARRQPSRNHEGMSPRYRGHGPDFNASADAIKAHISE